MSQGRRQRLRKAKVMAAVELETVKRHKAYDERQAKIEANKVRPMREKRSVLRLSLTKLTHRVERELEPVPNPHVRTSIGAIVCGYMGNGEGHAKVQWGYQAGKKRAIARSAAQPINTKVFVDNKVPVKS